MSDVQSLIESAEARGLRLFLAEGKVRVEAPQVLDGDTKALIEELRQHREQIKSILATTGLVQNHENLAPLRAWVVKEIRGGSGKLRAVLICSALLQSHLWVIWDRDFQPGDSLAIYFSEELPLLKGKSVEDLRDIHKVKLEFPGCRVIQEGPEGQKDLPSGLKAKV